MSGVPWARPWAFTACTEHSNEQRLATSMPVAAKTDSWLWFGGDLLKFVDVRVGDLASQWASHLPVVGELGEASSDDSDPGP